MAVTISRQTGSGGHTIGRLLARDLQAQTPGGAPRWSIFDGNLVQTILEEHRLPRHFARFMPEDRISHLADTIDEFWGVHPPSSELMQKAAETVLRLARQGNVVLIGRGANVITRELANVIHVRLVAPLARRVERIQQLWGIEAKRALDFIRKADVGRRRYLQTHFGQNIDDPLLYHLIINTDLVSYDQASRLIRDTVLNARAQTQQHNSPRLHDLRMGEPV
jgi:cytidylate kinase